MHRTTLHKRVLGALAVVGVAATMAAPANAASPLPIIIVKPKASSVMPQKSVTRRAPVGPPVKLPPTATSSKPASVPPPVPPAAKIPTATSSKPLPVPPPLPPVSDPVMKPLPVPTATGTKPSTSNTPRIPAA